VSGVLVSVALAGRFSLSALRRRTAARVHRVISLLKRWLLGTHQGAVSQEHLQDYLDEFAFRFNRRKSRSRGKLFFRLAQQAVAAEPTTHRAIVASARTSDPNPLGLPESNG
jgi:ISXO2-like transposase domain